MDGKKEYTKKEVAAALGISQRTVHFYTDEGLVTPEIANPKGKGTTRKYSRRNLLEFLVIRELARNGQDLKTIKQAMAFPRTFRSDGFHPWDPDKGGDMGDLRCYLVSYDGTSDHGKWRTISRKVGEPLPLDMDNVGFFKGYNYKEPYVSALVIDLTRLREQVRKI